jgi:exonuclease-1
MGIQGLLPFLKEIQRDVHVSSFRGRRVAVDSYCWLHRGAYSCALQLVMKTEKLESLPFIKYCMKRVNMLRNYDITPVMIFDGGYLPLKEKTEKERRERRRVNRDKGKALLREGKRSEAIDCFQKSVDVSPEMALALIKECRSAGVECIVAPYEADSQLAYLSKEEIVDLVITEDSDLVVFGCRKVMFKLDDSGNGKLIETQHLGKANCGLVGFTMDSFRHMCILSGCDYLSSVPGIGLGKALKLMRRFNKDPYRVIKALHYETGKVPQGYEANFRRADQTFLYQLVFDPRTQQQVRLHPLPSDVDTSDFEFTGVASSPRKAVGMARGNINPLNHVVMDTYSPSKVPPPPAVRSRSWGGSVMSGDGGWAKVKPPSSLTTSESIWKHFKPPKKLKSRPETTEDVDSVEDLQSTYLTATMGASQQSLTSASSTTTTGNDERTESEVARKSLPKPPSTKSRFFSTGASCEPSYVSLSAANDETPSDRDVSKILRAKRRISLMPPKSNGLLGALSSDADEGSSPGNKSDDELMAERCQLRRKRLNSLDNEQSVRPSLHRFAYDTPTTKKIRRSSPLSRLDQESSPTSAEPGSRATNGCVTPSPVKNPFAKIRTTPKKSGPVLISAGAGVNTEPLVENSPSDSHGKELEATTQEEDDESGGGMLMEFSSHGHSSSVTSTTTTAVGTSRPHPPRPFMTSEAYITTRSHSSLLNHVISDAEPAVGQGTCSSGHPNTPGNKPVCSS